MNIQMLAPTSLKFYDKNSKRHPQEQIDAIAKSISTFGFDQPVVVDGNMVIIKGHGRTRASIQLGLTEIPVVVRDDVSENDARFLREVDNQIQSADWDKENLASELHELRLAGKLELTLFTENQIPELPQMALNISPGVFDLTTRHACASCGYKW